MNALDAYTILKKLHERRKMDAASQRALEFAMLGIAADIVDDMVEVPKGQKVDTHA